MKLLLPIIEIHVAVCDLQATHRPTITGLLLQNYVIQVSLLCGVWNSGAAPAGVHNGCSNWFLKTVFKITYNSKYQSHMLLYWMKLLWCVWLYVVRLKKNQNAPRPEHPPVREENMSKRLGGIKGCKYKTSSWHLNGFPDGNNIGSTV